MNFRSDLPLIAAGLTNDKTVVDGNVALGSRCRENIAGSAGGASATSDVGNLTGAGEPGHLSLIRETVRHVPNNYAN